jgi:hypothetical protein
MQEMIDANSDRYGTVFMTDELMDSIRKYAKPLLSEFGKEAYIIYFVGDYTDIAMSVNDKDGTIAVNRFGAGFGTAEDMLNILKHEGAHGTYADADVDERAASAVFVN